MLSTAAATWSSSNYFVYFRCYLLLLQETCNFLEVISSELPVLSVRALSRLFFVYAGKVGEKKTSRTCYCILWFHIVIWLFDLWLSYSYGYFTCGSRIILSMFHRQILSSTFERLSTCNQRPDSNFQTLDKNTSFYTAR